MLIVDTNVLVDVLEDDPDWADWSIGQLRAQAQVHELAINAIIYAELSLAFATVEALDAVVDQMRLTVADVPRPALFLAGQAFLALSTSRWCQEQRAVRLLHWRACSGRALPAAHARRAALPRLLSNRRAHCAVARTELTFLNSRWFAPSSGPA